MTPASIGGRVIESLSLCYRAHHQLLQWTRSTSFMRAERSRFYRAIWEAAAAAAGASIIDLDGSLIEIRCRGLRLRVRDSVTSLDDPVTLEVAGNKPLVYRMLAQRQIPVPRHHVCRRDDLAAARRAVAALGGPCVIKPAVASSAGAGITTGVMHGQGLALPMARAGAYSRDVIVEDQVGGGNYRLLYLDGELIDAVLRRPPAIHGDGRSTVRQLIVSENARRASTGAEAAQSLVRIDRDVQNTLHAHGYHLGSIPASGAAVQIKTIVNDNRREENDGAADTLCQSIVACGSAAAEALGVRLAGVDVITKDPSVPLSDSGGVILEVNTTPGFYYHYLRKDEGAAVAAIILRRLTETVSEET